MLSCCLLDGPDVLARCIEQRVTPESFHHPAHGTVFATLVRLFEAQKPIDVAVLAEELKTGGALDSVGGYSFLTRITALIPTTAQSGYFIGKVREQALLRSIIKATARAAEQCYEFTGNIDQLVDQVEQDIFQVTQQRVDESAKHVRQGTGEAMRIIDRMLKHRGELTGVSSGFRDLDALLWGFQPKEMIVLAARPSMGKTSLALNFAEAAILPHSGRAKATLFFSLEMSASQLALRLLCSRARVNMKLLRDGLVSRSGAENHRLSAAAAEFEKAPLFIDDSSALSVMQLRAKARRVHAKNPLGLIVVDYLQLLSPTDPAVPREQQVAEASRGLKTLAKELDVPVIVLSQLNRSSEKENRTPRLADLRESGAIEQDADVVLMLARPRDADEKFQVAADAAELIVAKQRNGPVGEVKLTFLRDITRFENHAPGSG